MNVGRPLQALTADQQRLVATIASGERTRLLVIGPPGTGKTYAVSEAVRELLTRVPEARVLIIAPAALCTPEVEILTDRLEGATPVVRVTGKVDISIQAEAGDGRWRPGVYVISIDLARREDMGESLTGSAWDLVVAEEAHRATKTRADLLVRLAANERVRSLVLLSVLPLKDKRLASCLSVVRWTRMNDRPLRMHIVISYERTAGEQQLYFRLTDFLNANMKNLSARDVIERAWRSSITALEQVLVQARSRLEVGHSGLVERAERGPLNYPLASDEHTSERPEGEASEWWLDRTAAAAGMDELLRNISSLGVDSKLEAMLNAIEHRRAEGVSVPCVITAMRASAFYIAEALESRQQAFQLVDGHTPVHLRTNLDAAGAIVVATDPGLHGVALATDTILNYDLPRSRLRMEQRWGRIDRIGREQPVMMLALRDVSAVDAVEEELLRIHGFISSPATDGASEPVTE